MELLEWEFDVLSAHFSPSGLTDLMDIYLLVVCLIDCEVIVNR